MFSIDVVNNCLSLPQNPCSTIGDPLPIPLLLEKPRASPVSTSSMGENHSVLANTNTPSSSLMQIPIPTLSRESEKDVSMLHLYLPGDGFVQFLIALVACLVHILCFTSWAFVQLSSNALARSQIDWRISCKSFHTLLFLFFQILHMSVLTTER